MKALTLTYTNWPAQTWHLKESIKHWVSQLFNHSNEYELSPEHVDFFEDQAELENYLQSFRE